MLLDEVLRLRRDAIVATFVQKARGALERDARVSDPGIVDHVPRILDELADAVETGRASLPPAKRVAREHAQTRWHQGMNIRTLVVEYGILRACVTESVGAMLEEDRATVDRFFGTSLAEAVGEFATHLERVQTSLAVLSEAGAVLASASGDHRQGLQELAALSARRLADCCSVYLCEPDGLTQLTIVHRVPEKAALVRELYERFPLSADSPHGFPATVRTGRSELVRDVTDAVYERIATSPEQLALLRRIGAVSWMVVPLRVQGREPFGAIAMLNAESRRNFTDEDLSLAEELARRAALVLDHTRLFEMARRERARAEMATRAKDEFLAVVSHELRTPLNAVLGWARVLRRGTPGPEMVGRGLEVIERNAAAQAQLIGDLLDVSRIITGNVRLEVGSVEVSGLVEMAVEAIRPAAAAKSIELGVHIDHEAGIIRGDPARLQQVVWNLLTNAVKFTPKHGHVTVRVARVASDVEIVVEDDGSGIDAELLPFVFERFRQGDGSTARTFGGLGLGLAIAMHLVELHGGTIAAASAGKGLGATFTVRIPVSPLTTTASTRPAIRRTEALRELDGAKVGGMRVLLVDDEADARDLLAALLTAFGVEVRSAPTASAGFEEFLRFRPDVVLSDIGMPSEDGYSLARRIRALPDEAGGATPLIALTAYTADDDRTRARVEGFSAHVAKPVEPSTLLDELASFRFRA
jgi:signal transduction histidine kinase